MNSPKGIPEGHIAIRGDGESISATTGIVPILVELDEGNLQVIGTGFYITRYGLFLTARHVFDHIIEADKPFNETLRIFHDTGETIHIRHVTRISYSNDADIALVEADNFIEKFPENPLMNVRPHLTLQIPEENSNLITFAYPRNALLDFTDKSKPVEMFADRFEGKFVGVQEESKYGNPQIRRYQATIPVEGGASGGPVFDERGRVTSLVQSSMKFGQDELEGSDVSFLTPVEYSMETGFENLLLPESSWEYQQIPHECRSNRLTVRDLAAFGHVLFDPPIN